jgi:hypothetical protein
MRNLSMVWTVFRKELEKEIYSAAVVSVGILLGADLKLGPTETATLDVGSPVPVG